MRKFGANSCWDLANTAWLQYNNHYYGQSPDMKSSDFMCQQYFTR